MCLDGFVQVMVDTDPRKLQGAVHGWLASALRPGAGAERDDTGFGVVEFHGSVAQETR